MHYKRLTLRQRYQIETYLNSGLSLRKIAKALGYNVSTISRELKKKRTHYRAEFAEIITAKGRFERQKPRKKIHGEVKEIIERKLLDDWSPEQISARLKGAGFLISWRTIYRYVMDDKKNGGHLWEHLRLLRRCKLPKKRVAFARRTHMGDRIFIDRRPKEVEKRKRLGDYERDTLLGKFNGSQLLTLVDRTSRLVKLAWLPKKSSALVHKATVKLLKNEIVRTITNDNGTEFIRHKETAAALNAKVFFSRQYRSWERGTNENTNGLLRQYFPKERDIGIVRPAQLKRIEDKLNNRPRKCLGFKTPSEIHQKLQSSSVALGM